MIKFRLSDKENNEYVDLFPHTSIGAIVNGENFRKTQIIEVEVPAFNGVTQNISIQTNANIVNAPFEVHLLNGDKRDYNTLNQVQVVEGAIIITRLNIMPENAIKIALVFYGIRGE